MTNVATIAANNSAPRYFTLTQPIDVQKQIFIELVKNAKPNGPAYVHCITPKLAEWLLQERNGGNRRLSVKALSLYAEAMDEQDWPVTGATIIVGRSGRILDGQHRLMACARSGEPFMTYVVFGVDDGNFTRIDTGRRRSNIDAFTIAGVPHANVAAKTARWISILAADPLNRGETYTNEELLTYYKTELDHSRFNRCVELGLEIEKSSKARAPEYTLPAAALAALLYWFMDINVQDAESFAATLRAGVKQPAKAIYAKLANAKRASGGRIHEVFRNAIIVQGWNAMRRNASVTQATLNWATGDEFPTFE